MHAFEFIRINKMLRRKDNHQNLFYNRHSPITETSSPVTITFPGQSLTSHTESQQIFWQDEQIPPWMRMPCPIPTGKGKSLPKCRKPKWRFRSSIKYRLTQKKKSHDSRTSCIIRDIRNIKTSHWEVTLLQKWMQ